MKRFNFYLSLMFLLVCAAACSDEFDDPAMVTPVANHTPNMTIADFKAKYWQDAVNYIDTIKEDIVIHGWVTSTDESGNIYKCLYINDGTAGLSISINQNSLYNKYRIGQEIVLPLKGFYIGKYNGQQQLGYPAWYEKGQTWEATFLPQYMWESMVELNGLPDTSRPEVEPIEVTLGEFVNDFSAATLLKYQSRLVRINGVYFEDAGNVPYSEENSSTNRTIYDDNGNKLTLRNSNYADFRSIILPNGKVDIIGMLGSYSSDTWQLYLRTIDDVHAIEKGELGNPYSVSEVIANQGKSGWMQGYAVGALVPGVSTVTSNSDIEWAAPVTDGTTMVLAPEAGCRDYTQCVVVKLPEGTDFYEAANLKDYPIVWGTLVSVKGDFSTSTQYGLPGVVTNGVADNFKLSVNTGPATELIENFDSQLPLNWTNFIVSGDKSWEWTSYSNNGYATVTGYQGQQPPFDMWLVSPALDIEHAARKTLSFRTQVNLYNSTTSKFEVYVLNADNPNDATVKVQLNPTLATAPGASGWSSWVGSGNVDLSQWSDGIYYIGFRYIATTDSRYATWCLDEVKFGVQ